MVNRRFLTAASLIAASLAHADSHDGAAACPLTTIAYPLAGQANLAFGARFGFAQRETRGFAQLKETSGNTEIYQNGTFTAPQLSFDQVLGYGNYFYLQLRQSYGMGYVNDFQSDGEYTRRVKRAYFMDNDATIYFPFVLSEDSRLTLQPSLGFSMNYAYIKGRHRLTFTDGTLYKAVYYSPVMGLALGFMPTERLSMRAEAAALIPNAKLTMDFEGPTENLRLHLLYRDRLRKAQRSGLRASLDVRYQIGSFMSLNGECGFTSLNAYSTSSFSRDTMNTAFLFKSYGSVGLVANY